MAICLDSTVIIDFLKSRKEAIDIIKHYKDKDSLFVTEINVFEILVGIYLKDVMNEDEFSKAKDFFNSRDILFFDLFFSSVNVFV